MPFYTIDDINNMVSRTIVEVKQENKWIVLTLDNGIRIKIKNF